MFQALIPDYGSIFLPVSDFLGLSHSLVLLFFVFFCFLLCFILFSFPFPFLVFYRRLPIHKSRQKEKSPECQPMAQMAVKYKESKLGPRPLREFPGNYHGKYASSSIGRSYAGAVALRRI